ncbi:ComEC/Rec2 family competence protein [Microbacterium stercoris]|uniref:ComEC/Rec2 family competence protein n=1 Tax=Microbacterium stercoris TaxID=2820289 RepID=A0A939TUK9_9MICO|nr:ComEC/Rec2 family competence protein [Microbacterium stercoris]MBO3664139.1 ComEC/Rec2 family competence protein [Microbacterium stercoris]
MSPPIPETETELGGRDLRMVPVAAVGWAAGLFAVLFPAAAAWVAISAWGLAVTGVVARRWWAVAARTVWTVGVLACAVAGTVAAHVALAEPGRRQVSELAAGRAVEIDVVVISKVERRGGALWFDAEMSMARRGEERVTGSAPVTVTVASDALEGGVLDLGSRAHVQGSAQASEPGDRAVITLFARTVEVRAGPAFGLDLTAGLRDALVARAALLPQPGAMLLPGLAVGDTRTVSEELDAAMKASSLSHLTAVSGANCALVVGLAFGAASLLGATRAVRITVGLAALGGFILLVTPEPSVIRAGAMAAIALLALALGRTGAGVAVLSLATTVLLIADPWLATSYGFVLSVVATGSLLLLAAPLARGLSRWLPAPLALALSVPLSAQLACGPVLVLLAPEVPLYGVLANLLADPAAPIVTVVGLAACLAAPLPALADGLAAIAWVPSAWIASTAQTIAALPGARLTWPPGLGGAVLLASAGLLAGILILRSGSVRARDRRMRRMAAALLAIGTGAMSGAVALGGAAGPLTVPSDWAIAACDVGQGDALILRSADAVAVIDTGPEPDPLARCLSRLGIGRVDLLVLTHFDRDHSGGARALRDRVDTVLHGPVEEAQQRSVLDDLGRVERVSAAAGLSGVLGGARWRVVWPRAESKAFAAGNDASVVLEIAGADLPRTILLGDLGASAQSALLRSALVAGPYDVVKVAHHGSADQDPQLYAEVAAPLALISVGEGNDFGHPRPEILGTLANLGATIERTDEEGLVLVSRADGGVRVWRERAP